MHAASPAPPPSQRRPLLWYDAQQLATQLGMGSVISTWQSVGALPTALLGYGAATASSSVPKPILDTDAETGLPHVTLNRNRNSSYVWMQAGAPLTLAADASAPGVTLFLVARLFNTVDRFLQGGVNETLLSCSAPTGGTRGFALSRFGSTSALLFEHFDAAGAVAQSVASVADMATGMFEVYTLRVSTGQVALRRGNVASQLAAFATFAQTKMALPRTLTCSLGAIQSLALGDYFSGAVRELRVYGSALTNAQLDGVYEELRAKWQLQRLSGKVPGTACREGLMPMWAAAGLGAWLQQCVWGVHGWLAGCTAHAALPSHVIRAVCALPSLTPPAAYALVPCMHADTTYKPHLRWDASSLSSMQQAYDTPISTWPGTGIAPVAMAGSSSGGAPLPTYEQDPRSGMPRVRISRTGNASANWFRAQGSLSIPLPPSGEHAVTLVAVAQLSSLSSGAAPSASAAKERAWERILDLSNGPYSSAIALGRYGASDRLAYWHWTGSGNPNTSSYFVHGAPATAMGNYAVYAVRYRWGLRAMHACVRVRLRVCHSLHAWDEPSACCHCMRVHRWCDFAHTPMPSLLRLSQPRKSGPPEH